MHETQSSLLRLRGLRRFAKPCFLAAFAVACSSTSSLEPSNDKDASSSAGLGNSSAGASGSTANDGHAGQTIGSAGATLGGHGGNGGASAGAAGTVTDAGFGGAGAGAAGMGASAGSGGAGAGAGGNSGGGGVAGLAQAGSAGSSSVCHARPAVPCGGGPIALPRSCVSEAMAAGTSLPVATCRVMCESMFAYCSVSAVEQTTVTVMCNTSCPSTGP